MLRSRRPSRRSILPFLMALAAVLLAAAPAHAQVRILINGRNNQRPFNHGLPDQHAGFTFCRLHYDSVRRVRKSGWGDDYPNSDFNFMARLEELTTVTLSRWADGDPGFAQFYPRDPDLLHCPFVKMNNAANYDFAPDEVVAMRNYLLKGGFLWEDDNWTDVDWRYIKANLERILPGYPIVELTIDHPIFSVLYHIKKIPQIPSLNSWLGSGQTFEQGPGTETPHYYAIFGKDQRLLVLVSINSDVSDSWEREGDNQEYFYVFAGEGYAFGVNVLMWVMTH